jgi:hypothetical protein
MPNSIKHFLLVFDHEKGALVETLEFGSDSERAVAAYTAKEAECENNPAMEIVLIGSDSFETVQFTHANYFEGSAAARLKSPYLAGV